ncbi:hypothetical protein FSARC_11623 [Fusarium sarcochroum]|uniref:Inhibitor I9 domain-containing protein n=1 Tax=Fusarium sarcochroum TaxID=1208366 RepID=A0A8H4WZI6_9HYPO|nr:hypothetical protein FSARC_11623 [Fusarium sarcochroum]
MELQAPLLHDELPFEDRVKDSYVVYLLPGHSLDDHATAIQRDLKPHIDHVYSFIKEKVVYVAQSVDKKLLDAIRADRKVEKVEVNGASKIAAD